MSEAPPTGALSGRVFLITGGAGGIGAATCHALAGRGARLAIVDAGLDADGRRTETEALSTLTAELAERGVEAISSPRDITDEDTAAELVAWTVDTFGRLDGVVHAAGIRRHRMLLRGPIEDLDIVAF